MQEIKRNLTNVLCLFACIGLFIYLNAFTLNMGLIGLAALLVASVFQINMRGKTDFLKVFSVLFGLIVLRAPEDFQLLLFVFWSLTNSFVCNKKKQSFIYQLLNIIFVVLFVKIGMEQRFNEHLFYGYFCFNTVLAPHFLLSDKESDFVNKLSIVFPLFMVWQIFDPPMLSLDIPTTTVIFSLAIMCNRLDVALFGLLMPILGDEVLGPLVILSYSASGVAYMNSILFIFTGCLILSLKGTLPLLENTIVSGLALSISSFIGYYKQRWKIQWVEYLSFSLVLGVVGSYFYINNIEISYHFLQLFFPIILLILLIHFLMLYKIKQKIPYIKLRDFDLKLKEYEFKKVDIKSNSLGNSDERSSLYKLFTFDSLTSLYLLLIGVVLCICL